MKQLSLVLTFMLCLFGCHKTMYMNIQGDKRFEKVALEQPDKHPAFNKSSWYHYFINGWAPSERVIKAGAICGGAEHIVSINTQQSILQGLVKGFTTVYYIFSIYTPYDGHVVCDKPKMPEKLDSTSSNAKPESNVKPESNAKPDAAPLVP